MRQDLTGREGRGLWHEGEQIQAVGKCRLGRDAGGKAAATVCGMKR